MSIKKLKTWFKIKFGGELEFPAKEEFESWLEDQLADANCNICSPSCCLFARFIKDYYKNNEVSVGLESLDVGNARINNPIWVHQFIKKMSEESRGKIQLKFKRIKELWQEKIDIAVAANLD